MARDLMKYFPFFRILGGSAMLFTLSWAQPAPPPDNAGGETKALAASGSEVNMAVLQMGAVAKGADTSGMQQVLAGQKEAFATLAPNPGSGASVSVIQLGNATELARVALKVGRQRGKLQILVQDADVASPTAADGTVVGRVVGEFELDGTKPIISAPVNNVTARSVTVVWIPEVAGQPLIVNDVGVFAVANRLPPAVAAVVAQTPAATNSALANPVQAAPAAPTPAPATPAPAPSAPATSVAEKPAATPTPVAATPTPAPAATPAPVVTPTPTPTPVIPVTPPTTAVALPPQTRPLSVP